MEYHNLEFIIDKNRDSENLDNIRKKLFKCLLNLDDVEIKKNINFFNNTVLLNFINRNDIIKLESLEKKFMLKYLDMFHKDDFFISCDKNTINYLKLILNKKEYTILEKNIFMYYRGDFLTEQKRMKLGMLDQILKKGVGFYEDEKEITNILNVKNLKKINFTEKSDVYDVLNSKDKTNYYLLNSFFDKESIFLISESKFPLFKYDNSTLESKYYLINALKKIGLEENLPSYNLKNIVNSNTRKKCFSCESYNTYLRVLTYPKIKNFQYKRFQNLEEAIAFNIMLTEKNIHGILIKHNLFLYICYEHQNEVKDIYNEELSRERIILEFSDDELQKYDLKNKSLSYLVNICRNKKGDILLPDQEEKITPNGNLVPIEFLENRNFYHYNIFNDLVKKTKNNMSFNREKLNIDISIDVEFIEKIDFHYILKIRNTELDFSCERNLFIEGDLKYIENLIRKIWKKGYLLTEYSIYRYSVTGIIKNIDIKFPDWFRSRDIDSYNWLISTLEELN